jgi:predicted O-linked N-acetylglucosamine transferase (SPINDLY family)
MAAQRIAPDRLEIVGWTSPEDYFKTYRRIDIALDPFPFAGGTTTCDALWMGVPVVTLSGRIPVARAGVSILSHAGLPELIAQSPDQYIQLATTLAADLPRLANLRATLRDRLTASHLMNSNLYARDVEAIYRTLWRTWSQTI